MALMNEFSIGFMGFTGEHSPVAHVKKLGTALPLSIEKVYNNLSILANVTVSYKMLNSRCIPKESLRIFVHMVRELGIDVLIGPTCKSEIEVVGLLASEWNMPMVNFASLNNKLADKETYDTLLTVGGNFGQTGDSIRKFLTNIGAENICITIPFPKGHHVYVEDGVTRNSITENITILGTFSYVFRSDNPNKHNEILTDMKNKCRGKISINMMPLLVFVA